MDYFKLLIFIAAINFAAFVGVVVVVTLVMVYWVV